MAITRQDNIALRKQIEDDITTDLSQMGYQAISALDEYGAKGLSASGEEDTYIKLYNNGIDAVFTIALIDKSKETYEQQRKNFRYPAKYYYNRIWNYQKIQPDSSIAVDPINSEYFWESILFDLKTLEPQTTIQTGSFTPDLTESKSREFQKKIIRKMVKEKILKNQNKPFKAF